MFLQSLFRFWTPFDGAVETLARDSRADSILMLSSTVTADCARGVLLAQKFVRITIHTLADDK